MTWKPFLESVDENQGPVDQVGVNVRFEDSTTGKTFTRGYKLTSGSASALQDVRDLVIEEVRKLSGFDDVRDRLKTLIGKEIK